jgi:predicted DNA-binding transcriptional regulator AlpA
MVQLNDTDIGFLRLKDIVGDRRASPAIAGLLPISRAAWYAGIAEGLYPKPFKLGRASLWKRSEVIEMLRRIGTRS